MSKGSVLNFNGPTNGAVVSGYHHQQHELRGVANHYLDSISLPGAHSSALPSAFGQSKEGAGGQQHSELMLQQLNGGAPRLNGLVNPPPATLTNGPFSSLTSSSPSSTLLQHHFGLVKNTTGGPAPVRLGLAPPSLHYADSALLNGVMSPNSASSGQQQKEFRIQNEDFPALPGSENVAENAATGPGGMQRANHSSVGSNHPTVSHFGAVPLSVGSSSSAPAPSSTGTADGCKSAFNRSDGHSAPRGVATSPDGAVSNIPPQMLNDQFGMVGLLASLRAIYSDQRVVSLTLGQDMTTLGLDLNDPEKCLHSNFGGPWCEGASRLQDVECTAPAEYLLDGPIKAKVKAGAQSMVRLDEDALFYVFYQSPRDLHQMAAAAELFARDWRYHKLEKVWLTRQVHRQPLEQTASYERSVYILFDPLLWKKVTKEMKLEYTALEERPRLLCQSANVSQPPAATRTG